MKYNFTTIFLTSFKVALLALLFAPIILFFLNILIIKTETIDFSSFFILVILSGLQNIIFIILLLFTGKIIYHWANNLLNNKYLLLCNALYYLFLVLIFPLQSCIVFKCGFYNELYPVVLIVTIILIDVYMRYVKYKKAKSVTDMRGEQ